MEKNWMMVFSTKDKFHAMYLKEMLEEHQLMVVMFNKTEGPYAEGLLGEFEIFVHENQAEEALELIYNLPE